MRGLFGGQPFAAAYVDPRGHPTEGVQQVDDCACLADDVSQGLDALEIGAVAKGYVDGQLRLHFHLRLARSRFHADACELCAVYQAIQLGVAQQIAIADDRRALASNDQRSDGGWIDPGETIREGLVPVYLREFVEGKKGTCLRPVRTVVRLQLLDECDGRFAHPVELSRGTPSPACLDLGSTRLVHEGRGIAGRPDREGVVLSRLLMVALDEYPDHVVEGRAGLVERSSSEHAQPWHGLDSRDVSGMPFGLRVVLERDSYGFDVLRSMPLAVKGINAFVGEVELGPNAS